MAGGGRMPRVVVTGMGVVAPNALGVPEFEAALREGRSGIAFQPRMKQARLACNVAGDPVVPKSLLESTFQESSLRLMNSSMTFAGLAAVECWRDAGFAYDRDSEGPVDWDTGAIMGTGFSGMDTTGDRLVPMTNAGDVRRLGSSMPEQTMGSAPSAFVGGLLGLGGIVTTVSSACATGTETMVHAFEKIRAGQIPRILSGSTEGNSIYIWAAFDAMRVCCRTHNDSPEKASRPMSATAAGFVPSAGAAALMFESLESAQARGARIYAEVLGGWINSGGQRDGGTMTAPNPEGARRCVRQALKASNVSGGEIDYVNGHLTATMADPLEIANLMAALDRQPDTFPFVNSTKSMIGHALGASGALECVASVIQLHRGFLHPSLNCEDLHNKLEGIRSKIPASCIPADIRTVLKVSFGFGDVNACIVFKKWEG
jgi:3-oxoacyl-(acyl-carrier-protein) synthase